MRPTSETRSLTGRTRSVTESHALRQETVTFRMWRTSRASLITAICTGPAQPARAPAWCQSRTAGTSQRRLAASVSALALPTVKTRWMRGPSGPQTNARFAWPRIALSTNTDSVRITMSESRARSGILLLLAALWLLMAGAMLANGWSQMELDSRSDTGELGER